jgi:Domain of unknown function (DUF5916)/Carbohydrate family 9 binding domain-like
MRRVVLFFVVAFLATAVEAAPPTTSRVVATPIPEAAAVKVDGELNDAIWQTVPPIKEFVQREPKEGAAPTFETEARVAYDATALYIAVIAFDSDPKRIVGIRTRRDEGSPSDWISVVVDSFHDRRSAFEFDVNPAGVKQDSYWFNDTNNDQGWDAVWDAAVSRTDRGWRAEFRIPFSQLRYRPAETSTFGLAIIRKVGRLNETATWPLLSKSAHGYVSSFGELTGLRLERAPKRLEVVPYMVADVKTQPGEPGNPLINTTDPDASLGVDLKYALRPGLTLTGTINPDFGQVEADPAVVNLSAFETFFSERRPFFVEGGGIFSFDIDCNDGNCSGLFYSRRIGRSPRGEPDVPDGGYSSAPAQTTILGAAKLTGRIGEFSVGALNAVTAAEDAIISNGTVQTTRQTIEPLTNYSVVRARREFSNQSALGFMTTFTNRSLDASTRFLPGEAYTGGVDADWRLGSKYAIRGFLAGSTVHGDPTAIDELQRNNVHSFQRPDSDNLTYDPTRTAMNGYGGSTSVSKIAGARMVFSSNVGFKSPGFEINDVGFMQRADQRTMSNWMQIRYDKPSQKWLRSFRYNLNQWAGWNYDGDRLYSGINVNAHAMFRNNWATGTGGNINWQPFDDRATRGGPGVYGNAQRSIWAYLESDQRPAVSLGIFTFNSTDGKGTTLHDASPNVSYRPSSFLKASVGLHWSQNTDQSQWVEATDDGRYVFARIYQQTVGIQTRLNYTVTPALSIQLYAEPFVSSGNYTNFKELVDGRSKSYEGRYKPTAYAGNPDFNYRSFRTTNVLRWEYKPGSTLFVVWQQGREDSVEYGNFNFNRDFGAVFDAPAKNVFLVKFAYWFNP